MSVATIQPPAAIFSEEQYFARWVYVLLALMVGLGWMSLAWGPHAAAPHRHFSDFPFALLMGMALPPILVVGVLKMTTEVAAGQCRVWFGIVPTYRRCLPLDLIQSVEVVNYRPFRDHLFWGVRTTRDGERVMTARGNRAVRLVMTDGSRVLIGSQRAEELAECLDQAIRTFAAP